MSFVPSPRSTSSVRARRRAVAAVALLVAASVPALAAPASAGAATPRLTWRLARQTASVNALVGVTFTLANPPQHGSVVLQRRTVGGRFAAVTPTLAANTGLSRTTGSAQTVAPARGRYQYRVLVRNSAGRAVVTSAALPLTVYGPVQLSALTGGNKGSVTVDGEKFPYALSETKDTVPFDTDSCRSIQLRGVYDDDAVADSEGLVVISQGNQETRFAVLGPKNVYSGTLNLTPGSFDIRVDSETASPIYLSGTLSCWQSVS